MDAPIVGANRSFFEKLQEQMQDAERHHWMIVADMFYVFSLISSSIKLESKRGYVRWVVEHGGLEEPSYETEIWEAQRAGFSRTGQRYNRKYGQFWLLIQFAEHVKGLEEPEEVLTTPSLMQQTLDSILAGFEYGIDRAHDMRHAVLHMAFPDEYERIISTQDKRKIVGFYGNRLEGPVPTDLDEGIRRIRRVLAERYDGEEPFDFYEELNAEWRGGTPPPVSPGGDESRAVSETPAEATFLLSTLARTRNIILHGPPGTGKTYVGREAAEALVRAQAESPTSDEALIADAIDGLTFYDVLALSLYRLGPESSHPVSDILDHQLVRARYRASPVQNPRANIWGSLQSHVDPESRTVNTARRTAPYLFDKEETGGRWFLTESGGEYVEEELSAQLARLDGAQRTKPTSKRFVEWSTFHQSFAYEDFVEGLRPVPSEDDPGGVSYLVIPGVFRRICDRAAADPENKYVLVIDEINRGNIAKILGELMTLLEDDKRVGEPNELAVTLPYSGHAFSVPGNLYVIGTMNTADRSVALLDVALRRRFAFIEMMPNAELLDDAAVEHEGQVLRLGDLLRTLNRRIARTIDRDHQLGHSYLLGVAKADQDDRVAMLEFVWNNQIVPLLGEYFYAQREQLAQLLGPFRDEESNAEADSGDDVELELGQLMGDDLVRALIELVEGHHES